MPEHEEGGGEVTSLIDLYDHEVDWIDRRIMPAIARHQKTSRDLEAFRREVMERFAEPEPVTLLNDGKGPESRYQGLDVRVNVYETNHAGVYWFEFSIQGRMDKGHEFDHDRQVHEVTNDLLGLGDGGVIKESGLHLPGPHSHN